MANAAKFVNYVTSGGYLFYAGCTQSFMVWPPFLPGTTINNLYTGNNYNVIDDPTHPAAGLPSPIYGTWASYNYFTNARRGARHLPWAGPQLSHFG